jgi:DNA-directed RNA polymerase subunit RPC12/RpoP
MAEAISFWLDNKMSSGLKVAEVGSQILVSYREKFYVVENGAARMKGSRPLHYSKSSIPTVWRKVMTGKLSPTDALMSAEDENMPMATTTKKERTKMEKAAPFAAEPAAAPQPPAQPLQAATPPHTATKQPSPEKTLAEPKLSRTVKKSEAKPATQVVVVAGCPYCSHKHDLALEKGKNGKAFFVECARCSKEFAVRYVPVTVYQAQVAAFV